MTDEKLHYNKAMDVIKGDWQIRDPSVDELSTEQYHEASFVLGGYARTMQALSEFQSWEMQDIERGEHLSFKNEPTDTAAEYTGVGVMLALRMMNIDVSDVEVTLDGC